MTRVAGVGGEGSPEGWGVSHYGLRPSIFSTTEDHLHCLSGEPFLLVLGSLVSCYCPYQFVGQLLVCRAICK